MTEKEKNHENTSGRTEVLVQGGGMNAMNPFIEGLLIIAAALFCGAVIYYTARAFSVLIEIFCLIAILLIEKSKK